jgi:catechol 2,3-dioxygenase-like lactoylglutathione lyase family enzyme
VSFPFVATDLDDRQRTRYRLDVPIDHVNVPVSNLEASRAFYTAALAPFGYKLVHENDSSLGFGRGDGGDDDEPFAVRFGDRPDRGTHIAFTAADTVEVEAFHAAALTAGGRDNGGPGERPYGGYYYAAFVLDPDGHNVEAVYHGPRR